jgi:hypothetical protein
MEDMFGDGEQISAEVLVKVNKADLIRYIGGKIDILVDKNGKPLIVELGIDQTK